MTKKYRRLYATVLLAALLIPAFLVGNDKKVRALFCSLDQKSIAQHLSFYELYPNTPEGLQALNKAWQLLAGVGSPDSHFSSIAFNTSIVDGMVRLVNKQPNEEIPELTENQLQTIEYISQKLSNRKLKGFHAATEEEVLALPSEEIDIARAVILSQMDENVSIQKIRSYEAMIDLMTLQISTKLPQNASPERKIRAINTFIFEEMGFRFPPHSKYANDIDLYTFLPSVLDSRHGVCLGVSILYLSIAQRLDLPLEAITPPGHIYIRYRKGGKEINIETTARGIHIDSEDYLGIETKKLQERNMKEVVGLAHINHASLFLKEEKYKEALKCYHKALPYLTENEQLTELMGYCHLFTGEIEQGEALLRKIVNYQPEYSVTKGTLAEDYFTGNADIESMKAIFLPVDETRESILKKKASLEEVIKKHPKFRDGWQSLGITWLQLHRTKEALESLETYHSLDPYDPTVEYYLSAINNNRYNNQKAWEHLRNAEKIVAAKDHSPKALKYLRRQLAMTDPE